MDTASATPPVHQALDWISRMCIEENFLDEGERLLAFLEMQRLSPFTSGLLRIWARSQRGDLRDALRHCEVMIQDYPESSDVLALSAVLSYALNEPRWRSMCERLLDLPDCRAESRQVAASMLDGSFGKKKPGSGTAAGADASASETAEPDGPTFDPAMAMHFLRG